MFKGALKDFRVALTYHELLHNNSVMEMKQRYRRSVLGPFWISISLAVMVFSIGTLWSKLWKLEMSVYLPYFTVGLLLWTYISTIINESTKLLPKSKRIILQVNLPFTYHILNLIYKNTLIFCHHFVVYFLVLLMFQVKLSLSFILIIPGIIIYLLTTFWLSSCLSIICARYRDIEQIIPSIINILFFMTPILWMVEFAGKRAAWVIYNPVYHYIEILRAPLLGYVPTLTNYAVSCTISFVGLFVSLAIIKKYRKQIAYWL